MSPVIAVFLGWALLHESISILNIIAMVVILVGAALMVTSPGKHKSIKFKNENEGSYLNNIGIIN